jgi:hypothetical protein
MFNTAVLFLGLAGSVAAQAPAGDSSVIAGYLARSDATEYLEKDLIQKELEDLIGDESCESFALFDDFYNNGNGTYFSTIPTYGFGNGEELASVTKEYTKYYGSDSFTDDYIQKIIQNKATKFKKGNVDPRVFPNVVNEGSECIGREELVKKGLAYTSTLYQGFQLAQEAIHLAVNGCRHQRGCEDAVEAWDGSVATYVGSLEGIDGNNDAGGDYGKAPYALADKRCRNYANCGPEHDLAVKNETSPINTQVLALYAAGSQATYVGDYVLMAYYLRLLSNKAAVPLIQGTLRYAYKLSGVDDATQTPPFFGDRSDKSAGELGAFAFGALPKVWACSTKGEKKIFEQTKIGGGVVGVDAVNFQNVKLGFQCNYKCLGITCKDVGALFDGDATPKPGAEACSDVDNGSENVCDKPKKSVKQACKNFTGKAGIKGRDKLKFDIFEAKALFD